MTYDRFTLNAHPTLGKLLRLRLKEIPEYGDSTSAYLNGLVIFDLMARRPHRVTARLMASPTRVRDAFIADLEQKFLAGIRMDDSDWAGKLFEKLVAEEMKLREAEMAERAAALAKEREAEKRKPKAKGKAKAAKRKKKQPPKS